MAGWWWTSSLPPSLLPSSALSISLYVPNNAHTTYYRRAHTHTYTRTSSFRSRLQKRGVTWYRASCLKLGASQTHFWVATLPTYDDESVSSADWSFCNEACNLAGCNSRSQELWQGGGGFSCAAWGLVLQWNERERIGRSCGVAYLLWAVELLFTGTRSIHWGVRSWMREKVGGWTIIGVPI